MVAAERRRPAASAVVAIPLTLVCAIASLLERPGVRSNRGMGYLLIIEMAGGAVAYGDPEADFSEELIKVYDQEKSKEKK